MRAIAAKVGCSLGTVHAVLAGYRRQVADDVAWHRVDALQRLDHLEAEAVETSTSRQAATGGPRDAATVHRKARYDDPRLHTLLLTLWDRRCRLLGLLDRDDQRAAAVKLVAGVDPADLV